MSIATPQSIWLSCLQGTYPPGSPGFIEPQEALRLLKEITDEDHGFDIEKWKKSLGERNWIYDPRYNKFDF